MASIISAGTTSATALNMSADTSGVLQLASNNGTVAVTVTTAQNVGIGTPSPQRILTVGSGSGSSVLSIFGSSSLSSAIHFTDTNTATDFQGFVTYSHAEDALRFGTAETERMRITLTGNSLLGTTVDSGGRLQVVTGTNRFVSNANGTYRVFTHRTAKASNTTSTCAITFGNQGNQHASHIVEVLFASAQDDANGGVGGRATFLCASLTGVGTVSEIQDIGTGTSFSASASGDVLTITATTTSNRNVVSWTVKVTSTFDGAAPTQIVVA
jgi:hypothetical protein